MALEYSLYQEFFDKQSELIFNKKELAFIGVSPFSSYFNESNLSRILVWTTEIFQEVAIFIPDTLSTFTLEGIGYEAKEALHKTKRQDAYLTNKVFRAIKQLTLAAQAKVSLVKYSDISKTDNYKKIYEIYREKFNNDDIFKQACLNTTTLAMVKHITKTTNSAKAVEYFLREFPIFIDIPSFLNKPSAIFIYHALPPMIKQLYKDRQFISPQQGCLQLTFCSAVNKEINLTTLESA